MPEGGTKGEGVGTPAMMPGRAASLKGKCQPSEIFSAVPSGKLCLPLYVQGPHCLPTLPTHTPGVSQ